MDMTKRSKRETRIRPVRDALGAYEWERVYLFGFWARGEADDLSDLGLVIIIPALLRAASPTPKTHHCDLAERRFTDAS